MTDRVLVTGAGGFTGQYVVDALLDRNFEVWGLEARSTRASRCKVSQVELLGPSEGLIAVLRDFKPTHVIHLAAQSHVTGASAESHYAVNVIGTERLLRAIADCVPEVKRIVIASTANIYGNAATGAIPEFTRPSPANHYGFSKLVMEQVAQGWFAELPIVITRPFNYTGVGQSRAFLVPKIVHHFAAGLPVIRLGNIDVFRDISDVRFVTEAYCRLLNATVPGGIVNICSGRAISVREIIAKLEQVSGRHIEIEIDPALVRANEIRVLTGADRLLKEAIGPVELPDIEETLRWMYEHEVSDSRA
jgi:GDP-6-deoxy-D-talose 4-dehydrogenase